MSSLQNLCKKSNEGTEATQLPRFFKVYAKHGICVSVTPIFPSSLHPPLVPPHALTHACTHAGNTIGYVQHLVKSWYNPLVAVIRRETEEIKKFNSPKAYKSYGPYMLMMSEEKLATIVLNTVVSEMLRCVLIRTRRPSSFGMVILLIDCFDCFGRSGCFDCFGSFALF